MNGIQSLMPGQAAPQGMPPGMPQGMPQGMQPQPSSPQQMMQSQTPMLKQLPKEQLVQLFAQEMSPGAPQKFTPLLILSAISDKVKQEQMQRAMQMQQVQQQNAQQPPGTVAQQVLAQAQQPQMPEQMPPQQPQMQPPVMAAHGGAMHSYANGGAVAFDRGGDVAIQRILQKAPYERTSEENDILRAAGIELTRQIVPEEGGVSALNKLLESPFLRRLFTGDTYKLSPEELQKRTDTGATTERMFRAMGGQQFVEPPSAAASKAAFEADMARRMAPYRSTGRDRPDVMSAQPAGSGAMQSAAAPMATTFDITNPGSINALRMAAQDTSLPEAERADLRRRIAMMEGQQPAQVRSMQATAPRPNLTPEEEDFYRSREAALQGRRTLPQEVLAGRQGIAALAAQNLAAQRAEAEQFGTEARQRRDAAMARAGRSLFSDPGSLLALAGSIDTRRGQALGSAARGLSGLMARQEEARTAAGREYAQAQQTERMLQANIRQANMLEEQRKQAALEREPERVAQIEDALAKNAMERSQLVRQRQEYAEKMALEERKVDVDAVRALRAPTELELAMSRPEEYARVMRQKAEAAQSKKSPEQIRAEALERYADNWERLDMLQKNELAKQGVTNFQQYVRMRDQMAGMGGASSLGAKVMTMADVQATATASGKTIDEVRKAALAAGYTIQ